MPHLNVVMEPSHANLVLMFVDREAEEEDLDECDVKLSIPDH